jgi:hypothetical protein
VLAPLSLAVDPGTLFCVSVLNLQEGLVTLSPYETKALSTGLQIPPFIRALNVKDEPIAFGLAPSTNLAKIWVLGASLTETDAFSVLKITKIDAQP